MSVLKDFGIEDKVRISLTAIARDTAHCHDHQVLAITCDNASNNDTMIDNMEFDLEDFEGMTFRVRCFNHVVNLVTKTFTRLFNVKEKSETSPSAAEKSGEKEKNASGTRKPKDARQAKEEQRFRDLCSGLDKEELLARLETYRELGGDGDDNEEGWVDELSSLSLEELQDFEMNIRPVQTVVAKVRT